MKLDRLFSCTRACQQSESNKISRSNLYLWLPAPFPDPRPTAPALVSFFTSTHRSAYSIFSPLRSDPGDFTVGQFQLKNKLIEVLLKLIDRLQNIVNL